MTLKALFDGSLAWGVSFQYRDFRFLWFATLLHSLSMGMEQVALGWLVLQMTDSPFMVGVASAARMAPFFFVDILSGAIADSMPTKKKGALHGAFHFSTATSASSGLLPFCTPLAWAWSRWPLVGSFFR